MVRKINPQVVINIKLSGFINPDGLIVKRRTRLSRSYCGCIFRTIRGAPPQCRAGARPAPKKRLTGPVARATGPDPAASTTADYETLRSWARATPRPRSAPAGVALVLRQGLAHWLQVRGPMAPAPRLRSTTTLVPTTPDVADPEHRRAFITVLATMVEHAQQEVTA